MKKFFANDSFLKVFSFIVAIIIWFYIIIVLDPPVEITVRDIPIQYIQQNTLLSQGLSVVDESKSAIELKLKGSRKKIVNINSKNVLATVDLSNVTKSGRHTLPINVSIPYDDTEIMNKKPLDVEVVIDKVVEEKRNIRIKTVGNPETGYIQGTPEVMPRTVLIKGAASVVSNISDVRVSIDINDKKEDVTDNVELELVDLAGNVIDEKDEIYDLISTDIVEAEVFCPIFKLKTVPIKLQLSSQLPQGSQAAVQPNMITLYGYEEDIDAVDDILTEQVDVQSLVNDGEKSVELVLPENINLRDGVTSVTIKYSSAE